MIERDLPSFLEELGFLVIGEIFILGLFRLADQLGDGTGQG
jgi:hypothetical protein